MLDRFDGPMKIIMSILLFPLFFQELVLDWIWGIGDTFSVMMGKRLLLLLPAAAIIFACWVTIACLLTVVIRHQRRQYVSTLFVTWWDLFRAIFSFWGGFFKFFFYLAGWIFAFVRIVIIGLWLSLQDILLTPFRAMKGVGDFATKPGTPWIAVVMTLAWCALEAVIFTFVATALVLDTLGGLTGRDLDINIVQTLLFFMLLGFIVGSYAIVANLEAAIKAKNFKQLVVILIIEVLAMGVEVVFLYREFVDALVPWFAQYAGRDFSLHPAVIIGIAGFFWAGIRGLTWFLFAQAGTPTILAVIQRTGLKEGQPLFSFKKGDQFQFVKAAIDKIKHDIEWCHEKGDELLSAFILPPLQIIAATINFCTLLISKKHLFQLPFKSYKDMLHADQLLNRVRERDND